eukprot:CAMPEP_0117443856 /NCGR_PEP_ID=MMETSP0759-20121206/4926_1 /TAXON_ID=63605 /ORGANISM="Percolomonas cosmopolitus, Strain WS" /LENGTH=407 /DNA_ID=CAMNT_0005235875 /DNA_START=250 /DNA_END=1473 /DNA_ORIENTATION=+
MKRSRQSTLTSSGSIAKKPKTSEYGEWQKSGSCLIFKHKDSLSSATKVASFDFDSTLSVTHSGKTFPTHALDLKFWHDSVEQKLREYHESGEYKLVILTNQNGIGKGKISEEFFKDRMEHFLGELKGVPMDIYAATKEDHFRKPNTGMWELMEQRHGVKFDKEGSFYCGDAAGRPKGWKKKAKKDFSCSDRKFALNVGVPFLTPEELFLGEAPHAEFEFYTLTPEQLKERFKGKKPHNTADYVASEQEMIVFVAYPASGKSSFAKKHIVPNGYVHVNQDTMGTKAKCIKAAQQALMEGKSVVVDNTNPDVATRANYVSLAKKLNKPVRCFYFHDVDLDLAHHLNMYREHITQGANKHVPQVAYHQFRKKFSEPKLSEGFSQIVKIDFVPSFEDEEKEKKFFQHVHKK